MEIPSNEFKKRLLAGEPQYGLWLGLSETISAEICAGAGFDWLLIDAEHGPNDLRSILPQLQAIASYGSHPVVRPPHGDHVLIKQLLETGVQTLLIPMVESAEQAEHLVRAMRYPPHGIRGVGSALARASRWGRIADYAHRANDEMCLLVQVETKEGIANLEAIQRVEGVDGIFLEPRTWRRHSAVLANRITRKLWRPSNRVSGKWQAWGSSAASCVPTRIW